MTNRIILFSVLLLIGCINKTSKVESSKNDKFSLNFVKHNLYINNVTKEIYFEYKIPERLIINNQDVVSSHSAFDSTVIFKNEEIRIMSIIDTSTYTKIKSTVNFMDKNFIFNYRNINIKPKYVAVERKK